MTTAALRLAIPTPEWAEPLLAPARYKGISGGRAKGASHFFAEAAVEEMVCDPDLRFVCIREVQRSLRYSAKSLVEAKIRRLGVSHLFDIQRPEIRRRNGQGVMIFEGMQDHTADSIKSLEGFGRAWVEEAQNISQRSLDLLLPTIRTEGSEIWFSWNTYQPTDAVDKFFAGLKDEAVHVRPNYRDNPFCPAVMHAEAERLRLADPDSYEHIWKGGYFLGGHGRVYSNFSAKPYPAGNVDEGVEDTKAELLIGQDFNVNPMATVIGVRVGDELHILDAIEVPTSNTEEVVTEVNRRYPKRKIIVCPDPAGKQRHTSAAVGVTDFTIMQRGGWEVRAPAAAPLVVDRINNAQAMHLADGRRRVRIHPKAQVLITALTNHTYKEVPNDPGARIPNKKTGYDHVCDALDYLLWQEFNVLVEPPSVGFSSMSL